jgi:hypothetical protein
MWKKLFEKELGIAPWRSAVLEKLSVAQLFKSFPTF